MGFNSGFKGLIWHVKGKEPFKPARYLNVTAQFQAICPIGMSTSVINYLEMLIDFNTLLPVIQSYVYILE